MNSVFQQRDSESKDEKQSNPYWRNSKFWLGLVAIIGLLYMVAYKSRYYPGDALADFLTKVSQSWPLAIIVAVVVFRVQIGGLMKGITNEKFLLALARLWSPSSGGNQGEQKSTASSGETKVN